MIPLAFDRVEATGHPMVRATHRTTFEITKEKELTRTGTCILAVSSNKAASDLNNDLKRTLREGAILRITIRVGELYDVVWGFGSANLKFSDSTSMVFRKSKFIDGRTICVACNKSASDIDRRIIGLLASPFMKLLVELETFPRIQHFRDQGI